MRFIAQALYSLFVCALLPVLFGYFLWRSLREPDYRRGWAQRLGFITRREAECIWLHVASVGETQAALPLIERLLSRYSHQQIVISSFTPTGAALVKARLGDRVQSVYLAVDTPFAVARFLQRLRPALGVIVETELWPNLLLSCRARGIPLVLASATLSEKSATAYRRFPGLTLMREAMQAFQVVAAQTEADARRFSALGVQEGKLEVSGNLKFDLNVAPQLEQEATALRKSWAVEQRPLWIAASTHEGEEQAAIACFKALQAKHPEQLLILVPRHPQRFDDVAQQLSAAGLNFSRRSEQQAVLAATQVLLVDTLGEMMLFYALADIAFVGGSLVPIGGHNLLEPAALAKPVITGPYCESQQQLCVLLEAQQALLRVENAADLAATIAALLADEEGCMAKGQAALAVVESNRGSVAKIEDAISRVMP